MHRLERFSVPNVSAAGMKPSRVLHAGGFWSVKVVSGPGSSSLWLQEYFGLKRLLVKVCLRPLFLLLFFLPRGVIS